MDAVNNDLRCLQHNQTVSIIYIDTKAEHVLKCVECLIKQGITSDKIISIETIKNHQKDKFLSNWVLSKEQQLCNSYSEYLNNIRGFDGEIDNFMKFYQELEDTVLQMLLSYKKNICNQLKAQQDLKREYVESFIKSTYQHDLENTFKQNMKGSVEQLNARVKDIIVRSQNQANNAKQQLRQIINKVSEFNLGAVKENIKDTFKNILLQIENASKFNSHAKNQSNTINLMRDQPSARESMNNQEEGHKNSKQRPSNEMKGPSMNAIEILKLISNKSNGVTDQFLTEIMNKLIRVQEEFDTLNFKQAFLDDTFYPLNFENVKLDQLKEIKEYLKNPNEFKLVPVRSQNYKFASSDYNDFGQQPNIFEFVNTDYQQSKNLKITKKDDSTIINNTNKYFLGQAITHAPLLPDKQYTFRMSFNKSIIGNLIYFGLISSKLKDTKSLSSQENGFSISQMKVTQPKLLFGQEMLHRSHENVNLEVRINLSQKKMLIFSYPDFKTGLVQSLLNLNPGQEYHFGVEFQTENNFYITVLSSQIIE